MNTTSSLQSPRFNYDGLTEGRALPELGKLLDARRSEIVEQWCQYIYKRHPELASATSEESLKDHLPFLLRRGAQCCFEASPATWQLYCDTAATHGLERAQLKFSIFDTVRDFYYLRIVLCDFARTTFGRPVTEAERAGIDRLMDEASLLSVQTYEDVVRRR